MIKKEEFKFDSRDGKTKLHAVRWVPEGKVLCILQIVHGMAEHMERYEAIAQFLGEKGILVTGEDHLGHGKSISPDGISGYFCLQDPATVVVRDVHRLKKMTQQEYPGIPYIILGHSMGSFIFRNYLLKYGTGIQGAIISGTGMHTSFETKASLLLASLQGMLFGQEYVAKALSRMAFGNYNQKIPNARTEYDWLTTDDSSVNAYIEDPLCGFTFTVNGFKTLLTLLDRISRKEKLKAMPVELPVHFIAGAQDPVGDYGQAVKKVFDSFKEAGMKFVTMKIYEGCRHEVLNEKIKYQVYEDLYSWIIDRIKEY